MGHFLSSYVNFFTLSFLFSVFFTLYRIWHIPDALSRNNFGVHIDFSKARKQLIELFFLMCLLTGMYLLVCWFWNVEILLLRLPFTYFNEKKLALGLWLFCIGIIGLGIFIFLNVIMNRMKE